MASTFSSPAIAKELQRKYAGSTRIVTIRIRHEGTVRKFIMGIEDAHKKAAKSRLAFH